MRSPRARRAARLAAAAVAALAFAPEAGAQERSGLSEIPARPFRVIAHRGASAHAPENTLPAFRHALALGVREVELDVQLSSDDLLVLFHDATLDEKTPRRGPVRAHLGALLRSAEIGSWFDRTHPGGARPFAGTTLATLDELLDELGGRLYYHVELKAPEPAIPGLVLASLRARGLDRRATLTSFHPDQLERARRLDPELPICLLVDEEPDAGIEAAARAGYPQVALPVHQLAPGHVARARELGLELRAWGVRDEADMERAIQLGTNGMTIDWPERLLARLRELGVEPAAP
jgi:glycerophosphoryl diester phosphodiesterase